MRSGRPGLVLAMAVASMIVLGAQAARAEQAPENSALGVVHQLVAAFNRHDPHAMAALVAEEFVLYYMTPGDESVAEVGARGPRELEASMRGYFASIPSVRSEIVDEIDGPRFATIRERAGWTQEGSERSQTSIAVYEVDGGKIRRVWYYPAE